MSDPDLPDYVRVVVEAFIEARGRGTGVSSADLHLVGTWEASHVPLAAVLDGVDQAFRSLREPPASLRACAPFVKARCAADGLAASLAPGADDPALVEPGEEVLSEAALSEKEGGEAGHPQVALETRLLRLLRALGDDGARPRPVRRAAARLEAEVRELLAEEGDLSSETVLALDDAWLGLVLEESGAPVRRKARGGELRAVLEAAHGAVPSLLEELSG